MRNCGLRYSLAVAQSLSCVQLFVTPWTVALQASLSFTICRNLVKLVSVESVMPSCPLLSPYPPAFSLCPHEGFSKESAFHIKWPNTGATASASFVFWCYKVYKNGKYFISIALLHWKIFGVHIRYVKIRRPVAPERLTIKQSSPKILPMNIQG